MTDLERSDFVICESTDSYEEWNVYYNDTLALRKNEEIEPGQSHYLQPALSKRLNLEQAV